MRIVYQDGKLYVSLTDQEVYDFYENKHSPVELPIGQLLVLHEDISLAIQQHFKKEKDDAEET